MEVCGKESALDDIPARDCLTLFLMVSPGLHSQLNRVVALFALLLAIAWVPMTSHELLESAGVIHHDGPDGDHGPAHEAADGVARLHDGGALLKVPTFAWLGVLVAFVATVSLSCLLIVSRAALLLRRSTESPPGLTRIWQFLLRMALPSRAPSFAI
jgi:hypothetical protein